MRVLQAFTLRNKRQLSKDREKRRGCWKKAEKCSLLRKYVNYRKHLFNLIFSYWVHIAIQFTDVAETAPCHTQCTRVTMIFSSPSMLDHQNQHLSGDQRENLETSCTAPGVDDFNVQAQRWDFMCLCMHVWESAQEKLCLLTVDYYKNEICH